MQIDNLLTSSSSYENDMLKVLLFQISARKICEMFVDKHSETIECVKNEPTFLRNLQPSRTNNSRILRIKNANFSGVCFFFLYEHKYIGRFQICISVPLKT